MVHAGAAYVAAAAAVWPYARAPLAGGIGFQLARLAQISGGDGGPQGGHGLAG